MVYEGDEEAHQQAWMRYGKKHEQGKGDGEMVLCVFG